MAAVHKVVRLPKRPGWVRTECGVDAHPTSWTNEYDTEVNNRIEARAEWSAEVTCKRCLRSAPKPYVRKI